MVATLNIVVVTMLIHLRIAGLTRVTVINILIVNLEETKERGEEKNLELLLLKLLLRKTK